MAADSGDEQGPAAISTTDVLDGLNDLLQLDHDAIGAYQIAIERLENPDHASRIEGFRRDHERHVADLNALILDLGGEPVNEPHATGPFKEALQSLGALGGDRGVLMAFRTNELQVRTKYDSYASRAVSWPDRVKALIGRNALDEERHYRWVSDVLQRLGSAPGEGAATHAANRLREQADRTGALKDQVVARVGAARERAAHGVANGIEATASFLRSPDPERLRAELEARTRQNPLRMVLTTFAAGFVLGRILR